MCKTASCIKARLYWILKEHARASIKNDARHSPNGDYKYKKRMSQISLTLRILLCDRRFIPKLLSISLQQIFYV